jgi:hypothetical protein
VCVCVIVCVYVYVIVCVIGVWEWRFVDGAFFLGGQTLRSDTNSISSRACVSTHQQPIKQKLTRAGAAFDVEGISKALQEDTTKKYSDEGLGLVETLKKRSVSMYVHMCVYVYGGGGECVHVCMREGGGMVYMCVSEKVRERVHMDDRFG